MFDKAISLTHVRYSL